MTYTTDTSALRARNARKARLAQARYVRCATRAKGTGMFSRHARPGVPGTGGKQ
ncbi:MAG TPA: hypothetical protein VMV45_04700 [Casimicrobiaceae bacterium]|nr:hypothetical protein [Casimicrobiaceae bacterium]